MMVVMGAFYLVVGIGDGDGRGEMVSRKIMEASFGVLSGYWSRNGKWGEGDILGMGMGMGWERGFVGGGGL